MNTKQSRIKRNAIPEKYFDGKDLRMAEAIYKSDTKTIERLIKNEGYAVNTRGYRTRTHNQDPLRYTFLGYAVKIGEVKSAEKLLELGADPDLINDEGALWTNISLACSHRNKEMIALLVKYKENLNPPLSGSPIDKLLSGEVDKKLIEFLLANGADVNHPNYIMGNTAVQTAFDIYEYDIVNFLLDRGADPLQLDYHGNSLASSVQEQLDEGRVNLGITGGTQILKARLEREYGIEFPVNNNFAKGRAQSFVRYENLAQADKDFLGEFEVERINEWREGLKNYLKNHPELKE